MVDIHPDLLVFLFNLNYQVIKQQVDGLTHEDSLLQPPFRGNCLNWVLGHILISRDRILDVFGEKRVWDEETSAAYLRESDPITPENSDGAQPLDQIMSTFELSHERLMAILERITPADLEAEKSEGTSVGKYLGFMFFHDTYHTGQTEYLRQLAGKDDKVI